MDALKKKILDPGDEALWRDSDSPPPSPPPGSNELPVLMCATGLLSNAKLFLSGRIAIHFLLTIMKNMDKSKNLNDVLQKLFNHLWPVVEFICDALLMYVSADPPWQMQS